MSEPVKEQEANTRALRAELASVKEIQRLFSEVSFLISVAHEINRREQIRAGLHSPTLAEMQELNKALWLKDAANLACSLAAAREQKIFEALKGAESGKSD